jgi:predicted membrane channel-forming protein YqfA (hemolysin III family)
VYLIVIGWMYVVLMMSVAEATNTTGTVLGGIVTFFLYGILPVGIVVYVMRAPQRRRAIKAREAADDAARATPSDAAAPDAQAPSAQPDAGGEAPGAAEPGGIAPVRKEP